MVSAGSFKTRGGSTASPERCPVCLFKHRDDEPHNCGSGYYQSMFELAYGREATWADAAAHCSPLVWQFWFKELVARGLWTAPPEGCDVVALGGGKVVSREKLIGGN